MNKEIDFSQYMRKDTPQQTEKIDFSQYMREPEKKKEKKSLLEKGGRIASQFALGAAENTLLPYEIAIAPQNSKDAQNMAYRETVGEDIERLLEQKSMGQWDEQDQGLLEHLQKQIQDPSESEKFVQTADLGVRGIAEKVTGLDLQPEGVLEHAANWAGFIKDPSKIVKLFETGVKLPELIKAIAPSGKEALRGLGAGTALAMAEEGEFGPIGTMAAVIAGDIMGGGVAGAIKGGKNLITNPKKTLAEVSTKFTPKKKLDIQKQIIKEFNESGLQADLGTITDSNLLRWMQSRLAQSGLTGKALEESMQNLTKQIEGEYGNIARSLGELKHATTHEAGEAVKEGIKKIRETELQATRELYENANMALKENSYVHPKNLAKSIENIEKQLKPGKIKSTQQNAVLNILDKLKEDVYDVQGNFKMAHIKDLMNNKIALNDIINYEVQGGTKQLLKGIVSELDRAIISHGKENPHFSKNYINANKKFSEHAKTFRNKNIEQLMRSDPDKVMGKMNSVQGIRDLNKVLSKSNEGKEIFNNLKRLKLEKTVGDNLTDSVTKQAKLGGFSKLLEKGKNREVIKEILGSDGFKRLERLQKNAGKLAESVNKFYNASKSGSVATDAAIIGKGMMDFSHLLMGNPWPLAKTAGSILAARQLSSLIANPEFLKLTEEAILAAEKGTQKELIESFEKLGPYIMQAINSAPES